ncbi:MAG: hypothetical protein N2C14_32705, partial [Planctomycetales bacterium]
MIRNDKHPVDSLSSPSRQAFRARFARLAAVAALSTLALAEIRGDEPRFDAGIKVGFSDGVAAADSPHGRYKLGYWTQVEVPLQAGSETLVGRVALTVVDGDGAACRVFSRRRQIEAGQGETISLFTRIGNEEAPAEVSFLDDDNQVVCRRRFDSLPLPLAPQRHLILAVGSTLGLPEITEQLTWREKSPPEIIPVTDPGNLPTRWYAYEAVDLVVLTSHDPSVYQSMEAVHWEALTEWVRQGGRLLLVCEERTPRLLSEAPQFQELGLLPGEFTGRVSTLRSGRVYERFAGVRDPLFPDAESKLSVPQFTNVRGKILASEGSDLPVVVKYPYGFGRITFVGGDLDSPLFANWKGKAVFHQRLHQWPTEQEASGSSAVVGVTDLASQLRNALAQFPGVRLIPFELVVGLIFAYILLIGPGDYFLVKKVFRRMEWTWITFPAIVAAVSVGA